MSATKILLGLVVGLIAIALLGAGCSYVGYNHVVALDESVKQQWAQIDTQLQRRWDLIPQVEATVKGLAGQERQIFLGIANARKAYFAAGNVAEKAEAANQVEHALSRLLFLQEKYPDLKSNEAFMKLQDTLEGTENRISTERRKYNESVETLNAYIRQIPGRFYAMLAGVQPATYFKPDEGARDRPNIKFTDETKG